MSTTGFLCRCHRWEGVLQESQSDQYLSWSAKHTRSYSPVSQTGGACSRGRPSYLVSSFASPSFTLPSSVPVAVFVHAPLLISVPVSSTSSVAAPVPIVPPAVPKVAAAVGQNNQEVLAVVSRKSRKPREWPLCSRSSARLAAKSIRSFRYTPGQVHSKSFVFGARSYRFGSDSASSSSREPTGP